VSEEEEDEEVRDEKRGMAPEKRVELLNQVVLWMLFNYGVKSACKERGVERVRWNAMLDDRVCDLCADMDGRVWNVDEAPEPPIHPNCRCILTPSP